MAASDQPTPFARSIRPPNETWLAKQPRQPILDPELSIIDTHQRFRGRPHHRHLLGELLGTARRIFRLEDA
jgi:hypothetical protein